MREHGIRAEKQVYSAHHGNDALGKGGDLTHPAKNGKRGEGKHHKARQQGRDPENLPSRLCRCVALHGSPQRQGAQKTKKGKERGEKPPKPSAPSPQIVHGTALIDTVRPPFACQKSENDLAVFQKHRYGGRDPHPKEGSRTARGKRQRNTRDIPHAQCPAKCEGERSESRTKVSAKAQAQCAQGMEIRKRAKRNEIYATHPEEKKRQAPGEKHLIYPIKEQCPALLFKVLYATER